MKLSLSQIWKHPRFRFLLKILFSIAALWFVYARVDLLAVLQLTGTIPVYVFILSLVLYNASQVMSSKRLLLFLHKESINISYFENLKLYYQGMYFNLLLPGGVGGDGYKAYRFKKDGGIPVKHSVRALLTDRINGAMALLILSASGTLLIPTLWLTDIKIWIALFMVLALLVSGVFIIEFFEHYSSVWWKALGFSLLIQGLQVVSAILLFYALQVESSSLPAYAVAFLVGSLASAIPVTVGGLGARELVFIYAAKILAINTEKAVAVATLFFFLNVISSLPGLFVFTRQDFIKPTPSKLISKSEKAS